jgi:hypothetical protein
MLDKEDKFYTVIGKYEGSIGAVLLFWKVPTLERKSVFRVESLVQ